MRQRDSEDFSVLVREHMDMLLTYVGSMIHDSAKIDDIFQETMLVAWRRFDDYDRSRPLAHWLRAIARKLIVAHSRRLEKRPAYPGESSPGMFTVESAENIILHDDTRNKDLPVSIYFPKEDGKYPVIVFSHGAMGSGDMGFPIVRHWASHGYVVLCPTHGDSIKLRRAQGQDGVGDTLARLRDSGRGALDNNWTERPRDVSFVLDSLGKIEEKVPTLKGRLDRERMAVGGHSLGAYAAQVAAGATVKVPGLYEPRSLADPRLKAVLQLSGQGTNQQGLHSNSWDAVKIPMMCVTGSLDRAAQRQEPLWRREPFQYAPPGDKYFLFIEGALHGSFTGKIAEAGAWRPLQMTPEQRQQLRERLQARQSSSATKGAPASSPMGRAGSGLTGRPGAERAALGGAPADQKAIFEWVKQATTAFWDVALKHDTQARAWLESDSLAKLSHGAAKLERK